MPLMPRRPGDGAPEPPCLADVPVGADAVLADLRTPARLGRRLAELGLRPGRRVAVVQRLAGGGRIIRSGGMRYAVDRPTLLAIGVER